MRAHGGLMREKTGLVGLVATMGCHILFLMKEQEKK